MCIYIYTDIYVHRYVCVYIYTLCIYVFIVKADNFLRKFPLQLLQKESDLAFGSHFSPLK